MALFAPKIITSAGTPFTGKDYARMSLACLSYANLCFLNVWAEIADHTFDFSSKYSVSWQNMVAIILDVLIVAAVVWVILYLALSSGNKLVIRAVKWGAALCLLFPLNVIRSDRTLASFKKVFLHAPPVRTAVEILGAILGLILLFYWERLATRITVSLLILVAPCLPLVAANAGWHIWTGPAGNLFPNKALEPAFPHPAGAPHLIWVIFDEWDQALTFRNRPARISLPEVDRFQSVAFHADRVYPPANATIISVPSLLIGKTFIDSTPKGTDQLLLNYDLGKPPVELATQSTIFAEARQKGFNIGIAGWYIPYCRIVPECTSCLWASDSGFTGREESEHPSVRHWMARTFMKQLRRIPGFDRIGPDFENALHKELHAASYEQVRGQMLGTITDPRLNLVFVHIGIPHPPAIYLASTDAISSSPATTYVDNLRLVDRTIGDLRRKLEEGGMWDTSTILLTADHPYRLALWSQPGTQTSEVPYLLKMAGEKQGFAYHTPMQEIVTKELLLTILNGDVTTPDQVATWLDRHPPHQ